MRRTQTLALIESAREQGREAREKGQPREACPLTSYHGAGLRTAWLEGWASGGPAPERVAQPVTRVPVVTVQQVVTRWPEGKPLPTHYERQPRLPCPSCLAVYAADVGQAVVCMTGATELARLRCRLCGHTFKMPVLQR